MPVLDDTLDEPDETFTVILSRPVNATLGDDEGTGTITDDDENVSDPSAQAWLERFGRTAASHVVDALHERMRWSSEPPPCPPDRRPDDLSPERERRWRCRPPHEETLSVTIGGQQLSSSAPMEEFEWNQTDPPGDGWVMDGGKLVEQRSNVSRKLTAGEFLAESSFYLASKEENGHRWSFWGRGAFSSFDDRDDALTLGGDITTGTLGADYSGDQWLAGVALSHSEGRGTLSLEDVEGRPSSSVTGFYPYLLYGVNEWLSVWGIAGHGVGTLKLKIDGIEPVDVDIAVSMGAVGARSVLVSPEEEDFTLVFKADVLLLRNTSDKSPGLTAVETDVSRLRLGLEGSYESVFEDGAWLAPFVEANLRYDGGDVEDGFGIEVSGGFRYSHPELFLTMEINAHTLLAHESKGLAEWGASGSLRYDPYPSSDMGLSLTLSPAWGAASPGNVDTLWSHETVAEATSYGDHTPGGRLDADLKYGFAIPGAGSVGIPYAGVSLWESGRTLRVGYRLGFRRSLELRLEGTRQENTSLNAAPNHGIILWGSQRW